MEPTRVEVRQLPGRGRGLVATRTIAAGEPVLVEEPVLLTVSQEFKDRVCANCLCWLEQCPGAVACQDCGQAAFCSPQCLQQAAERPWVHSDATCRAYAQMPQLLPGDVEAQAALRFLIQAAALKHAASGVAAAAAAPEAAARQQGQPSGSYGALMALAGEPTQETLAQAAVLQPALCRAIGDASGAALPAREVAALLAKEAANSYGLLAPLGQQGADGQRVLRGGGLYAAASLVNHECLPNAARFDALDGAAGGPRPAQWPAAASTAAVVLRAMHELPAGTEVVQSYFPLNWTLAERQHAASRVYGFTCACPRCLLEASDEWREQQGGGSSSGEWETDEGDDRSSEGPGGASGGGGDAAMEEAGSRQQQRQQQQPGAGEQGEPPELDEEAAAAAVREAAAALAAAGAPPQPPLEPSYLSVFLLKFTCPRPGCFGTMAALQQQQAAVGSDGAGAGGGGGGGSCECSVCGLVRSDAEFLAELEGAAGE